jgi:hypothetical protein
MKDREVKQVLSEDGYQWKWEGHKEKERVKESEYGGSTMYSCMKNETIRSVETVLRGEKGR